MFDMLIHVMWKLTELIFAIFASIWILSLLGIPQILVEALEVYRRSRARARRRREMKELEDREARDVRVRERRMLRDERGRFKEKVPSIGDPHDPAELARIEAEIEDDLRSGRRR